MKSLEELKAIRDKARERIAVRDDDSVFRIPRAAAVAGAACGKITGRIITEIIGCTPVAAVDEKNTTVVKTEKCSLGIARIARRRRKCQHDFLLHGKIPFD